MATINPAQDYDMIQTLTFAAAYGTCKIKLYRGSTSTYTGTVKVREGTSGTWSDLSVPGTTTFDVTNTTMQVAHDWNKSGNNYMTCSFNEQGTNLTSIAMSQKAVLSGVVGNYFMYNYANQVSSLTSLDVPDTSGITTVGNFFMYAYAYNCGILTSLDVPNTSNITSSVGTDFMNQYAQGCSGLTSLSAPDTSNITTVGAGFMRQYAVGCSNLTSLSVPDTSGITTVSAYFMRSYAQGCTNLTTLGIPDTSSITTVGAEFMYRYAYLCNALTTLILPSVGWFATHNVTWDVPAARLTYLKGQVLDSSDVAGWRALTTSTAPNTLYLNYIRSAEDVLSLAQEETGTASSSIGFQTSLEFTRNINITIANSIGFRQTLEFDNAFITTLSNSIGHQGNLEYSKVESVAHNNLQPYIVVYRYRRTA